MHGLHPSPCKHFPASKEEVLEDSIVRVSLTGHRVPLASTGTMAYDSCLFFLENGQHLPSVSISDG